MTSLTGEDEELTALYDADLPQVDLVGKGANGVPRFLIAKQDAGSRGLVPPEVVRELIGKETAPGPGDEGEQVTVHGTPAAIAKLIHEAAQAARRREDDAGLSDGTPNEKVSKDMVVDPELDDGVDRLDPTVPLAAPDDDKPGNPVEPGSPAWEAIDAATAQKWCSILARAKVACEMLAERELLEAAAGDEDDAEAAWDLQDACCAIDYAIDILAPFAVAELSEADSGAALMMVGKATAADPGAAVLRDVTADFRAIVKTMARLEKIPLGTVEGFAAVQKAGRVLSAANEGLIRDAAASLQTVLASLPQAPQTDESGRPVAKTANEEDGMPSPATSEDATAASGQEPAMGAKEPEPVTKAADVPAGESQPAAPVVKADGEKTPMCVVYDQKGRLIGIVDPSDVTPVSNAEAEPDEAPQDGDGADGDGAPAADGDLTPAPAGEAGTPASAVQGDGTVTKTPAGEQPAGENLLDVLQSMIAKAVTAALDAHAPAEDIAKTADVAGLSAQVEELAGRLAVVEKHPAAPGVFANGQTPPDGTVPPARPSLRGQDHGAAGAVGPDRVAKALEDKRRLYGAADAEEQDKIAKEMHAAAVAALQALHARGPVPVDAPATRL